VSVVVWPRSGVTRDRPRPMSQHQCLADSHPDSSVTNTAVITIHNACFHTALI
jgi:hypothetical protein